ncbi:MAG: 50S ribosomal protein L35 [Candidatus Sungbacteria bacterium]|uniref:50S ribosomal protein L35 n=1 Tax=Candidatus Sungiibacteriota bacterium TaxID=2750080 RepID=A0A931SB33_9BACT|nr:50S ribosomal protein L35 [Candidatus Sungbacteria bacterium]
MLKTRKSVTKRIKITSTGKQLRRAARKNHFNAKERRTTQLRGQAFRPVEGVRARKVLASLPNR